MKSKTRVKSELHSRDRYEVAENMPSYPPTKKDRLFFVAAVSVILAIVIIVIIVITVRYAVSIGAL
ncbi:MAG: hypothetical protein HQ522_16205 [Bacteroidetes bacterium]|nr:hypothetical protein [Bacteroidota bacterium]